MNLNIEIKKELKTLLGEKIIKKQDIYYMTEFNLYSFLSILSEKDNDKYKLLKKNEKALLALKTIILENKNNLNNITNINYLYDFLYKLNIAELENIGKSISNNLQNIILSKNFIKNEFKALLYTDKCIDYNFIFNELKDLDVIFIYNEKIHTLTIISKDGYILKSHNIFNDLDLLDFYNDFTSKSLIIEKNKYLNENLNNFLKEFLNLDSFFNNFIDEILNNIFSLLNVLDLDQENLNLLNNNIDKFKNNEKIINFINNLLFQKNNEKEI